MSLEANKEVARTWMTEIINNRDLTAIDRAYAPGYVHRGPDGHEIGLDESRRVAEMLLNSSNDRRARVVSQIAEGDWVVTRWESVGTHTGTFFGQPATHKQIAAQGIVISRIVEGRIVEDWEMLHLDRPDTESNQRTR